MLLIKHQDNKINFIDSNDVFVGFNYDHQCCENFGYWFSYKNNANTVSIYDNEQEQENEDQFDFDGYIFDKEWYREITTKNDVECAVFKLIKRNSKNIYLTLYNSHNGFYWHSFTFESGKVTLASGSL